MPFFKAPATEFTNKFDVHKFKLTWNLYFVALICFVLLGIIQYIYDAPDFHITMGVLVLSVSMLVLLKIQRKFYTVALITLIVGCAANQLNIFTVMNGERFIDLLWIIVVAFYVFYMLGTKWGIASLVLNFSGLIVYILAVPTEVKVAGFLQRNTGTQIEVIVNCVVTVSILCYLLVKAK